MKIGHKKHKNPQKDYALTNSAKLEIANSEREVKR